MPLFKEWEIGNDALAAIWKIEEPESFFTEQTGIESDIKNERRRIEHIAGRFLLKHLKQDFPLLHIRKDEHEKPRLGDNAYFFSISHSWPYVAVIIDPNHEVGIDIQTWHPKIENIKNKFLSPEEQSLLRHDPQLFTVAWSAKEAAYKWRGRRGVDFIAHLPIHFLEELNEKNHITINITFEEQLHITLIENIINADFTCSYVVAMR
jgi:phosphopantetheinyl transferase